MAGRQFSIGIGTLRKGEIEDYFDGLREPFGRGATHAVREAGTTATDRIRSEVRRNFRERMKGGSNFANSFRSYDAPKRGHPRFSFSYKPSVTVLGGAQWAHVFEEGATIRPSFGEEALAIPTDTAEKLGLDIWPQRNHRRRSMTFAAHRMFGDLFVVKNDGKAMLAAKEGDETLFLFTLKRSVREPKKLSFYKSVEWAARFMPSDFHEAFRRYAPK